MDSLAVGAGLVALVLGTAIGWLLARSRFRTRIVELNTNLVLERRINKQLCEAVQVNAAPGLFRVSELTMPAEPARESMVLSG
jgi:hypothetical protein